MDPAAEAARAASTYQVAVALMGAKAFREIIELWQRVSQALGQLAATSTTFTRQATVLLAVHRQNVRRVAVTHTRLSRALRTGYTYPDPENPSPPGQHKLNELRREFYEAVEQFAPEALTTNIVPDKDPFDEVDEDVEVETPLGEPYIPYDLPDVLSPDEDDSDVISEEISRLNLYVDELDKAADTEQDAHFERILRKYEQDLKKAQEADEAAVREARAKEAHRKASLDAATQAERITQNSARHFTYTKGHLDRRVLGFVRVHHPTGDSWPCGFCCMLMSRQVFYKTAKSAGGKKGVDAEGRPLHNADEFHGHCHCTAEEVYSQEHYDKDPRFALNRELWRLWKANIQGKYSGTDALNAFRSLTKNRSGQAST